MILNALVLLLVNFSLFLQSVQAPAESSATPWQFPGPPGRRFPIVANNVPRYTYTFQPVSSQEITPEALRLFLSYVQGANFTIVRTSLSPSTDSPTELHYYEKFAGAIAAVNRDTYAKRISFLACDARLTKPWDNKIPALLTGSYPSKYLYGFSVDEPYPRDFPWLAFWCTIFNGRDPSSWFSDKLLDVNLFGASSIGDFEGYVGRWLASATPRTLSDDNYPVWDDSLAKKFGDDIGGDWTNDFFYNLEFMRQCSVHSGLPFWNWILVHRHWSAYSHRYYRRSTAADIRLQVYSSLAYGAKGICYYSFWNPPQMFNENGWHEESGIIDTLAQPTALYGDVREINASVLAIGDTLLQLTSCGVYHASADYGRKGNTGEKIYAQSANAISSPYGIQSLTKPVGTGDIHSRQYQIVKAIDNDAALVGIFLNRNNGEYYLFLVNKNRRSRERLGVILDRMRFRDGVGVRVIDAATSSSLGVLASRDADWHFSVDLEPGGGKLIRLGYGNE
jgi:hypothetical protein